MSNFTVQTEKPVQNAAQNTPIKCTCNYLLTFFQVFICKRNMNSHICAFNCYYIKKNDK